MKQFQHNFGGIEYTLDVGKMYFSKFFGEATKSDPIIDIGELLTNTVKQFDFVVGLVYGGVNCFNKNNGKEFVKLETVQQWVGAMEDSEAALLIEKYVKAVTPDEPGEDKAQAVSP